MKLKRTLKSVFTRITLLVFGLVIGLILAEIVATIYTKTRKLDKKFEQLKGKDNSYPKHIGQFDAELGWGLKPEAKEEIVTEEYKVLYAINSKGLRDKEISFSKSSDEFRVVLLGESNVFGIGINYGERFSEIIEQACLNIEVVNMAVEGYGLDQTLLQLKRDAFQYYPDVVILCIPIQHFLERCTYFKFCRKLKPRFALNQAKEKIILQDLDFIEEHFCKDAQSDAQTSEVSEQKNKFKVTNILSYLKEAKKLRSQTESNYYWEENRRNKKYYNEQEFRKLLFLLLKEYKEVCNQNNIDFCVVYASPYEANYMANLCKDLGVLNFDLTDVLKKAKKVQALRFDMDEHYNTFWHRVVGEYISDYLINKYKLKKKNYNPQYFGKF